MGHSLSDRLTLALVSMARTMDDFEHHCNHFLKLSKHECLTLVSKALVDYSWVCDGSPLQFDPGWIRDRFTEAEIESLSAAGRIVFLQEEVPTPKNKTYEVLLFRNQEAPGTITRAINAPCPVRNCRFVRDESAVSTADLIMFHLQRLFGPSDLPSRSDKEGQIWMWFSDECPRNTFHHKNNTHAMYNGIFNWSLSYRLDTDAPNPYGHVALAKDPSDYDEAIERVKSKTKLMANMRSNCKGDSGRSALIEELVNYSVLDKWGGCGAVLKCPGSFWTDCHKIDVYQFYGAFESYNCVEYITEKVFWNSFHKYSVPLVLGGTSRGDYEKLLPPKSFIRVEDFDSTQDLVNFIKFLSHNEVFLLRFHEWRKTFSVVQDHIYFGHPTRMLCQICIALNFNSREPKVYSDMESFWSAEKDCNDEYQVS